MSWSLRIYTPLGPVYGSLLATITEATDPPVIDGDVTCVLTPPGNCETMTFRGLQDQLAIPTRAIIWYAEDGTDLFYGPVVVRPSDESYGAGPADSDADALMRYTVAGGKQLMQESPVEQYLLTGTYDIGDIAKILAARYAHKALTVSAADFDTFGKTLISFYSPEKSLADVLDVLVQTAGGAAIWYVDAGGHIHFEAT